MTILGRRGIALVDVIVAMTVFTVGALVAAALVVHSMRLELQAQEVRIASGRMVSIGDSLAWSSGGSSGSRSFTDGRVRWRAVAGMRHLEAWGRDTTGAPLAEMWARP